MEAPTDTKCPHIQPLKTLEEFLSWYPGLRPDDVQCIASRPLLATSWNDNEPRLVVCHDMQGGYLEDRFPGPAPRSLCNRELYVFRHWFYLMSAIGQRRHVIDTFIYFSHHLITIPPPGWINAAHSQGCQVLGTFITEWDAGRECCERLFSSREVALQAAEQLAIIARHFGFEGWLVNIENTVNPVYIGNILLFLRRLKELQVERPAGLVMWYDAVTVKGKLEWQDSLNHLNRAFFDAAGSLFVNYTWHAQAPAQVAAAAGSRARDVYMGIDVFGRGTWGGGGFRSNVALRAAFEAGVSAALFAPGWTYEQGGPPGWQKRDEKLWDSLAAERVKPRAVIRSIPFTSCFDLGTAHSTFAEGRCTSTQPYFDLSRQAVQPLFQHRVCTALLMKSDMATEHVHVNVCALSAQIWEGDAWEGGHCLRLEGRAAEERPQSLQLFAADVVLPSSGLTVSYTVALGKVSDLGEVGLTLELIHHPGATDGCHQHLILGTQAMAGLDNLVLPSKVSTTGAVGWQTLQYSIPLQPGGARLVGVGITCFSPAGRGFSKIDARLGARLIVVNFPTIAVVACHFTVVGFFMQCSPIFRYHTRPMLVTFFGADKRFNLPFYKHDAVDEHVYKQQVGGELRYCPRGFTQSHSNDIQFHNRRGKLLCQEILVRPTKWHMLDNHAGTGAV